METDLTVNPRKRRAESPIPDADVVLDSPEATPLSDIRIDTTKLPPLPSLAPHLQHLPYIRWQKSLPTNTTSFKLLGDHVFHKRQGFVGYAILRMLVVQWLVFAHPYLHASVAAVSVSSSILIVTAQSLSLRHLQCLDSVSRILSLAMLSMPHWLAHMVCQRKSPWLIRIKLPFWPIYLSKSWQMRSGYTSVFCCEM